jgi:uncharacterized coiled-coil protein SlyX
VSCLRCAEQRALAEELNDTLNATLDERDDLRRQLAAIRAAYRAYNEARAAYTEGWGTADARETATERAYYATGQTLAELMKEGAP